MLKVLIQPESLAFQIRKIIFQFTVFKVCFIKSCSFIFRWLEIQNLSRLFTVQLSMFFVVFSNSDILSQSSVLVNNFFILFCFVLKQFVVTRLRQLVNNTKPSFICQQLFSSFYFMNVRITCPDSLPIHLNTDVRHRYFPRGEYYTNIIFFYCQHTFFIFYTYILLKFLL